MALKHPRIRFSVTLPDGGTHDRTADVSGYVTSREKLLPLLLHPWPDGTKITNLRQVGPDGKDLPEQPEELKEPEAPAPAALVAPAVAAE